MDASLFSPENYQWQLSLYAFIAVLAIPALAQYVVTLIPAFKEVKELNGEAAAQRVGRLNYPAVQNRSKYWGLFTQIAIYALILPFCLTSEPQPWWQIPLDIFVILMVYDFFYYLVHRFLFHEGGIFGGPLMWVHAVHHRQKDPCRKDSNYLHPIETCMGLGLYGACIGGLSLLMGDFHIVTIIITWIAFSEINLHNHDKMKADQFPFKYLKYMSDMHHVHHARFTAGNFATITLLYDWLFGTYDKGQGYKK
jgi:sterol desaturase/sphingolipid hydroxylase (fatty acid hydroxylase superfamily)